MQRDKCRECGAEIQDGDAVAYTTDLIDGERRYWHKACMDAWGDPAKIERSFRAHQQRKAQNAEST